MGTGNRWFFSARNMILNRDCDQTRNALGFFPVFLCNETTLEREIINNTNLIGDELYKIFVQSVACRVCMSKFYREDAELHYFK